MGSRTDIIPKLTNKNFSGSYNYKGFQMYMTEDGLGWLIRSLTTNEVNDSVHTYWQAKELVDKYERQGIK
tara:strand:- start:180 stop:389 length:210 start_codon:yes stop_codon:yes gene_type:complete